MFASPNAARRASSRPRESKESRREFLSLDSRRFDARKRTLDNTGAAAQLSWNLADITIFSPEETTGVAERAAQTASGVSSPFTPRAIQAKRIVNRENDPLEQEADTAAALMTQLPDSAVAGPLSAKSPRLQGSPPPPVGGMPAPPLVEDVLHSPGRPLDSAVRAFMEPRFGRGLGDVRVHTDDTAAESARAINALAYTSGQHIVFGSSRYSPQTDTGRNLLAHELAHTIQQRPSTRSSSGPSAWIQRSPGPLRPAGGPFATADQFELPDVPDQTLPSKSAKNLTKVTINNLDRHRTESTTMDAVRSSTAYVDNGIVSVGAELDNLMYAHIKALRLKYVNKPDMVIPLSAIKFVSGETAFDFAKSDGVIYPLSGSGEVILNDLNTPDILKAARMKLDDRAQALALREEIAWTVYAFAGAVAQLGGYASSMESIHSLGFSIGESLPSRSPKSIEPTQGGGSTRVNEISTLTNLTHDVPGEAAVRQYTVDSGFSAVYDPATESFAAVASGENTRLLSGKPVKTVPQFSGHADAEAALVAKLGQSDSKKHVGFVIIWKGNDTVQLRWNSGTINSRNFGDRAAPLSERAAIIQSVEKTLNVKVIE